MTSEIIRDHAGVVRALEHLRQPYQVAGRVAIGAVALADAYLAEVAGIYGIRGEALARLEREDTQPDRAAPDWLVRSPVTPLPDDSATVAYAQRHANLEVWEAGIAVTMLAGPLRVVSSRSSYHHDVTLANASVLDRVPRLTAAQLASALGLRDRGGQRVRIHATRLRVYRYDVDDPNAVGKRGAPQRPGVAGPEPSPRPRRCRSRAQPSPSLAQG